MKKKTYTKEQVLEAIKEAFYNGIQAGQVEYGDDTFIAEDYLPEELNNSK